MFGSARWRALLGRVVLILLSVAGSLLLLEGVSRVLLYVQPPAGPVDEWVFLSGRPPPYAEADYFSHDFIVEAMHSFQRGGKRDRLADYRGDHVNIIDGLRRTTDPPAEFDHRLLMFGASTTFSRRVPDRLTIPSHLQRLINAKGTPLVRVVNHAYPGDLAWQQLERLKQVSLDPGDIVVFYDGIAEISVGLYLHRHQERLALADDGAVRRLNPVQRIMYDLRLRGAGRSAFIRLLFGLQRSEPVGQVETPEVMRHVVQRAAESFLDTLLEAHRHVESRGARFYHFLQPTLYVQDERSDYENWVVENELKRLPGFDEAFRIGYPLLRDAHREAQRAGVASFDITNAFDGRPPGEEIYFDTAHVNHRANERIARRIYAAIFTSAEDE